MPPLAQLEAFEAVGRHGSFLAAATALALTPSAISHRIRALEGFFGERLFERQHRKIVLTARGAALHGEVACAFAQLAQTCAEFRAPGQRQLRLSVAPAFARAWLLECLTRYAQQQPMLEVELAASTRLEPILSGEADLAIRYLDEAPGQLASWQLSREWLFPVCSPAYARAQGLQQGPSALAGARLLRHPLLAWTPWFECAGLAWPEPQHGPLFDDASLLLEACAGGQGLALCTSTLAASWLADGRLLRPFTEAVRAGAFFLIAAPHARDKPWVEAFARWLAAQAKAQLSQAAPALGLA